MKPTTKFIFLHHKPPTTTTPTVVGPHSHHRLLLFILLSLFSFALTLSLFTTQTTTTTAIGSCGGSSFLPQLDGIAQMVATCEVYAASGSKINGEIDLYAVLGLDPSVARSVLKKQYKKMAVLLHPEQNFAVQPRERE
ncbi:hypothetical protein QVD17_29695 [Tagetes erecta]|uniref:J domain-containing protein n=1 Tax=Tagetes erecta TaxID=13708 RepID=A0AAD8NMS7_TARER|nr:hypothetical protein QVD17_29695 [Tagetes erecta]